MKKLFLLFTFAFSLCTSYGQNNQKIDSLKQILKTLPELDGTNDDTVRMKIAITIGDMFKKDYPDSALLWYKTGIDTTISESSLILYNKRAILYGTSLIYTGDVLYKKNNFTEAKQYFRKAIKTSELIKDTTNIALALGGLGVILLKQADYINAKICYKQLLTLSEIQNNVMYITKALCNLGVIENQQGESLSALTYYMEAMKKAKEMNNKAILSSIYNNIGIINVGQGNYNEAETYYKLSLSIKKELSDKQGLIPTLNSLGNLEAKRGNFPSAINYFENALETSEEKMDNLAISTTLNNLGLVYNSQGNTKEAKKCYERALKLAEDIQAKYMIAACYLNLGLIECEKGNYTDAKKNYNSVVANAIESGNKMILSLCYSHLGYVEYTMGNYDDAITFFNKSVQIAEEINNQYYIAINLLNYGIVESLKKNHKEAILFYEKSFTKLEELGQKGDLAENYPRLARSYAKENKEIDAINCLFKAIDITYSQIYDNFLIQSESERELFLKRAFNVFNDFHYFNNTYNFENRNISDQCYNIELTIKGLLLKSVSSVMNAVYQSKDTEICNVYSKMKECRNKISSLQGSQEVTKDSLINDLENKANDFERKLVRLSSGIADIKNLFEYKWEDVQKNLKTGEAAIEFISFTQGDKDDTTVYAALVITPESKMPVSVKLFEDNELQKILGKSTGTGFDYVNSLYSINNTALYDLVWKPLEPTLAGINTVYFAPVGVLNKISFAALSKESGKILCDIYNLHQVSTTGKLISKEDAKESKMTAAVFGGIDYNPDSVKLEAWKYLPGTLNEKNSIEKQLKKNRISCQTFSGKEAREEDFKALFDSTNSPSILHVSTHGFFYPDPEKYRAKNESESEDGGIAFRGSNGFGNWMFLNNKNPMMRSGLVFAGANRIWSEDWGRTDNEGVLTAYEVSNMNMRNTDLVVLSACETGLGDIRGSEGVYGLQRAFKMAGVKYIIMSLWQVPDKETVEFMEMFYKKLLKKKDVRQAFNETQKEMRGKYDPYYWAAFVLIE